MEACSVYCARVCVLCTFSDLRSIGWFAWLIYEMFFVICSASLFFSIPNHRITSFSGSSSASLLVHHPDTVSLRGHVHLHLSSYTNNTQMINRWQGFDELAYPHHRNLRKTSGKRYWYGRESLLVGDCRRKERYEKVMPSIILDPFGHIRRFWCSAEFLVAKHETGPPGQTYTYHTRGWFDRFTAHCIDDGDSRSRPLSSSVAIRECALLVLHILYDVATCLHRAGVFVAIAKVRN